MEADKSKDLQDEWASWRARRANGAQFWSKSLQTQDPGRADASMQVQRQEKANVSVKGNQAGGIFSYSDFLSIRAFS